MSIHLSKWVSACMVGACCWWRWDLNTFDQDSDFACWGTLVAVKLQLSITSNPTLCLVIGWVFVRCFDLWWNACIGLPRLGFNATFAHKLITPCFFLTQFESLCYRLSFSFTKRVTSFSSRLILRLRNVNIIVNRDDYTNLKIIKSMIQ